VAATRKDLRLDPQIAGVRLCRVPPEPLRIRQQHPIKGGFEDRDYTL
jgi:hypothetical protein